MICKWIKNVFGPRHIEMPKIEKSEKPSWFLVAEGEIGIKERPGGDDNPRILEYHQHTSLKATEDSVAWCSSFANACLAWCGLKGTGSAAARSFLKWGVPLKLKHPKVGAITVFWRGDRNGWQGHVGFYVKTVGDYIYVLGGNQSDEVNIQPYHKDKLLGYRWPS